jgi:hypothetical protein
LSNRISTDLFCSLRWCTAARCSPSTRGTESASSCWDPSPGARYQWAGVSSHSSPPLLLG